MKKDPHRPNPKLQNALPQFLGSCLISAFLVLAVTGCKHEPAGNSNLDITGIYALTSVDGKIVPCDLTHEGAALTVKSGIFTIQADGRCRSQSIFSITPGRDVHREVKATYTCEGTELTMRWEGAGMTKGNVNGNTFTMNNEGMIFVYRK